MINIDQVDKSLIGVELELLLNKFVAKHATNTEQIVAKNTPQYTPRASIPHVKSGVEFHDARFPEADPIGAIFYDVGNSNPEYRVNSRLIDNAKHRWSRTENTSFRTKDVNKALKNAVEYIDVWDMREFVIRSRDNAHRKHRMWVDEKADTQWKIRPEISEVIKEIENLQAMGYQFITEGFQRAASTLPEYKEYLRRGDDKFKLQCVYEALGKVYVITQDKIGTLSDGVEYSAVDTLPEKMLVNMSILKMASNGDYIPNVGYRAEHNCYWVYEADVL